MHTSPPVFVMSIFATLLALSVANAGEPTQLDFRRVSPDPVIAVGDADAFDAHWVTCPTVIADETGYHLWYSSLYDANLGRGGIGYAHSPDGTTWERLNGGKPVLSVGPKGAGDEGQVMGPEVLRVGDEYWMWYTGMPQARHTSRIGYYRIFLATSRDGIHWTPQNNGLPVLDLGGPGRFDEVQAATPSILHIDGEFRMWYAAWSPNTNHTICVARSEDGVQWSRENDGRPIRGLDPPIAFGHAVCRWQNRFIITYMALQAPRGLYGAVSDEGFDWKMLNDSRPILEPGSPSTFDAHHVGHAFLLPEDNRLRMWYTGYESVSDSPKIGLRLQIGLAEALLNMNASQ